MYFAGTRVPAAQIETTIDPSTPHEELSKIDQAVQLVKEGQQPMQGILMLRDILEDEPNNIRVHYHLGEFSMQSGQYEKAEMRFKKVLELDSFGEYTHARFWLGNTYAAQGRYGEAIVELEQYKELVNDTIVINGVDKLLKDLKNRN